MQIVSDLQQRPRKGRLPMEKRLVPIYDIFSLVQLVVFVIHTVQTTIGAHRTFNNNFFLQSDFSLNEAIVIKTQDCVYNSTRSIYAFTGVDTSFTADNVNDVFVDQAIQMRLGIFVMAAAFAIGTTNRICIEVNFFVLKVRNFSFWKDILSAVEMLLLAYVFVIAASVAHPSGLLDDYLTHCGMQSRVYLPFISAATMWVFGGVGFGTYALGLVLYLSNTLPKYGIMTEAEIGEYKEWLRARRSEKEHTRMFIEQAKRAQARMMLMQSAEYPNSAGHNQQQGAAAMTAGGGQSLARSPGMMMVPMPMTPEQQVAMAASAYPYTATNPNMNMNMNPYPYMEGIQQPGMNPNLPAPQMFGMQSELRAPQYRGSGGMPMMMMAQGPPPSVNMPRRRTAPSLSAPSSPQQEQMHEYQVQQQIQQRQQLLAAQQEQQAIQQQQLMIAMMGNMNSPGPNNNGNQYL